MWPGFPSNTPFPPPATSTLWIASCGWCEMGAQGPSLLCPSSLAQSPSKSLSSLCVRETELDTACTTANQVPLACILHSRKETESKQKRTHMNKWPQQVSGATKKTTVSCDRVSPRRTMHLGLSWTIKTGKEQWGRGMSSLEPGSRASKKQSPHILSPYREGTQSLPFNSPAEGQELGRYFSGPDSRCQWPRWGG